MTPPIATNSPATSQTNFPGKSPGVPSNQLPPQAPKGSDQYFQGKPSAPIAMGPLGHPIFEKLDPSKYDQERAKKFISQGKEFFDKKDFKKAEQAYQSAFLADPKNDETTLRLAEISFETGDLKSSYDYLSLYLERNPNDFAKRGTRIQIAQSILAELEKRAQNSTPEEIARLEPVAARLVSETKIDQVILLAGTSEQQLEGLKQLKAELEPLHSRPMEEKLRVLREFVGNLLEMSQLAHLPFADPELAAMVSKEIPKIVAGTLGALSSFAASDEDKNIQNLAPLLESYRLLEQGNIQDALPLLEMVRSNGFKEYGEGDETKGRDRFLKGLDWVKSQAKEIDGLHKQAKQLLREGKGPEADIKIQVANGIADHVQKIFFDGLPSGLMDAHRLLKMDSRFRMSRANLAILALMKKEIQSSRSSKVEEYTNTWSVAWRSIPYGIKAVIGSDNSKFDDINAETAKSLDLVDEIERKIDRGEAESIKEALQQIQDKGPDPLKTSAKEFEVSCGPILKGLIQYVGDTKPNEALEQALLTGAKTFGGFLGYDDVTSTIYGVVRFYSRNAENRKLASKNLQVEKVPAYVREQTEVPGSPTSL